jgi:hypothetical protein
VARSTLPRYIVDVKNVWNYTFTAPYAFFILDRFVTERFVSFELRETVKEEKFALGENDVELRTFCTEVFPLDH